MWEDATELDPPESTVEEAKSSVPADVPRPIRSRFTPAPRDASYLSIRDQLYRDYLTGARKIMCPQLESKQRCMFRACPFLHGEICEFCNYPALDPADEAQQVLHIEDCLKKRPTCCICFNVVRRSTQGRHQAMYGLLINCQHAFCFECIITWRKTRSDVDTRACPVCRTISDFVCPSPYWAKTDDDKYWLFTKYKTQECRYVTNGMEERCPFRNACLFRHNELLINAAIIPSSRGVAMDYDNFYLYNGSRHSSSDVEYPMSDAS